MRRAAAGLALVLCASACRPAQAGDVRASVRLASGAISGDAVAFAGTSAGLPSWLRWALTAQLQGGATPGTGGFADGSDRALAWTVPLASGLLQPNDRLSLGVSLGSGFGWSQAGEDGRDPGALATPVTRFGAAIGYQVTPSLGLYVTFDHVSVSGIAREDEIADDLGLRLGLRF